MGQITSKIEGSVKRDGKECFFSNTSARMDEPERPLDRRIQRTRQLLRDALFMLMLAGVVSL